MRSRDWSSDVCSSDLARVAIADASAAGIRVLMITGDHPRTAARIAGDLGIVSGDARVLAGDEIEELDDEALGAAVGEVSVYARVAPEHKLRIVDALQAGGNIVAMTGDGVNEDRKSVVRGKSVTVRGKIGGRR